MSGNLKHVREMSGIMLTVREESGKNYCQGKLAWLGGQMKKFSRLANARHNPPWTNQLIFTVTLLKQCTGTYIHSDSTFVIMMNLIVWLFALTLVLKAYYEYCLTWTLVPRVVREMSGNFRVSGEWSPCTQCLKHGSCHKYPTWPASCKLVPYKF